MSIFCYFVCWRELNLVFFLVVCSVAVVFIHISITYTAAAVYAVTDNRLTPIQYTCAFDTIFSERKRGKKTNRIVPVTVPRKQFALSNKNNKRVSLHLFLLVHVATLKNTNQYSKGQCTLKCDLLCST